MVGVATAEALAAAEPVVAATAGERAAMEEARAAAEVAVAGAAVEAAREMEARVAAAMVVAEAAVAHPTEPPEATLGTVEARRSANRAQSR